MDRISISKKILQEAVKLRKKLHQHPELSCNEKNTSELILSFLKKYKPDKIISSIGGYGIAAIYDSGKKGLTTMFRCELDALPITEKNKFKHKSLNEGLSHKCGHDGHMAIVSTLAMLLHKNRPVKGKVILLYQASEENGLGALNILNDKKFKLIEPDYIFSLHNLPGFKKNQVIMRDNIFSSASRGMTIRLKGETSHAAHPENARTPSLAMAQIIQSLVSVPTQKINYQNASLITIIHANMGEVSFGTTPAYAEIRATLRSSKNEDIKLLAEKATELVKGISNTYNLECKIEWSDNYPASVNYSNANKLIKSACKRNKIKSQLLENPMPWSEDFANFLLKYKGAIFGLGAGINTPQLHNSKYDFPDTIIETGALVYSYITQALNN